MDCSICGQEKPLVSAIIEGVSLSVCSSCARFGKTLSVPSSVVSAPVERRSELVQVIVEDCADLVKQAREHLQLTVEAVANQLREKESLLHKIEQGSLKPDLALAKKLEKFFHLNLVVKESLEEAAGPLTPTKTLTLGDLFKKKDS